MNTNKLLILVLVFCRSVHAEVVTDGSVGKIQNLSGQMVIPQSLGTTKGSNLFHSFKTFNINSGESATFTSLPNFNFKNVISRVTGGEISKINGLLKSEIPNANFYFINPAGVTFGAGAQVDVPAAFHVSTADQFKFTDGSFYSATNPNASSLTVAAPEQFGFIGTTPQNNGLIKIDGEKIVAKSGQSWMWWGEILRLKMVAH
jgi:filamentous hemagglutinin family protein